MTIQSAKSDCLMAYQLLLSLLAVNVDSQHVLSSSRIGTPIHLTLLHWSDTRRRYLHPSLAFACGLGLLRMPTMSTVAAVCLGLVSTQGNTMKGPQRLTCPHPLTTQTCCLISLSPMQSSSPQFGQTTSSFSPGLRVKPAGAFSGGSYFGVGGRAS